MRAPKKKRRPDPAGALQRPQTPRLEKVGLDHPVENSFPRHCICNKLLSAVFHSSVAAKMLRAKRLSRFPYGCEVEASPYDGYRRKTSYDDHGGKDTCVSVNRAVSHL